MRTNKGYVPKGPSSSYLLKSPIPQASKKSSQQFRPRKSLHGGEEIDTVKAVHDKPMRWNSHEPDK